MRELYFSAKSETSLESIAEWSTSRFGPVQTDRYVNGLLVSCRLLATGKLNTQSCSKIFTANASNDLRFARAGKHFIIFTESSTRVLIVDFIHQSADVGGRLEGPDE